MDKDLQTSKRLFTVVHGGVSRISWDSSDLTPQALKLYGISGTGLTIAPVITSQTRYVFEPQMDLSALRAPESSTKAPYIAFVKPTRDAEVSWVMVKGSVPQNYNRDPHPRDFLEISKVHDGYYDSPNSYFPSEWERSKTVWDTDMGETTLTLHPAA
ncbi:hypothetical protein, partial [Sansalvadorimonas verongulae]|uniref:hypothetical protein n=1 Tax=Sansalvadorimonas verongulae TaxID=2172824 RepID=UPI0018AD2079